MYILPGPLHKHISYLDPCINMSVVQLLVQNQKEGIC